MHEATVRAWTLLHDLAVVFDPKRADRGAVRVPVRVDTDVALQLSHREVDSVRDVSLVADVAQSAGAQLGLFVLVGPALGHFLQDGFVLDAQRWAWRAQRSR